MHLIHQLANRSTGIATPERVGPQRAGHRAGDRPELLRRAEEDIAEDAVAFTLAAVDVVNVERGVVGRARAHAPPRSVVLEARGHNEKHAHLMR